MVSYAKELLLWFVNNCKHIYGSCFNVYNVHALTHLADDVTHYGCTLNEISAFKFENYMQTLKKMVRNSNNPLCQIQKRLAEKNFSPPTSKKCKMFVDNGKDIYFLSTDGNVCKITKFVGESNFECDVIKPSFLESFYKTPMDSKQLNIYHALNRTKLRTTFRQLSIECVDKKLLALPYKNGLVYYSLQHIFVL